MNLTDHLLFLSTDANIPSFLFSAQHSHHGVVSFSSTNRPQLQQGTHNIINHSVEWVLLSEPEGNYMHSWSQGRLLSPPSSRRTRTKRRRWSKTTHTGDVFSRSNQIWEEALKRVLPSTAPCWQTPGCPQRWPRWRRTPFSAGKKGGFLTHQLKKIKSQKAHVYVKA